MTAPDDNPQQRLAYDRTLLANERTYAAWLRTGLAVAAFGFALAHVPERPPPASRYVSASLIVVGAGVIAYGGWRFSRVARDLREAGTPSVRGEPTLIATLTIVLALLVGALLFLL